MPRRTRTRTKAAAKVAMDPDEVEEKLIGDSTEFNAEATLKEIEQAHKNTTKRIAKGKRSRSAVPDNNDSSDDEEEGIDFSDTIALSANASGTNQHTDHNDDDAESIDSVDNNASNKNASNNQQSLGIYDKTRMLEILSRFRQKTAWIERLDVTAGAPVEVDDPNDDLSRELQFYNQALASVKAARKEFDRQGILHVRPNDYFAQMLKSDTHMAKVKDKLLVEQKRMDAFEQRKKAQEARKFAKQVHSERQKDRAAQKRANLDAVKRWQKDKASRGGIDDADKQLEAMLSSTTAPNQQNKHVASKKRQSKDKKYGFGGSKRFKKENDATSAGNTRSFSMKRNRSLPTGMSTMNKHNVKHRGKKNAGANRPGKAKRAAMRGGRA